jgi:ABC-type branched-chain amino acid transport systems, ATPase component
MSDILKVENVTLQFGGVKAITDINYNVKEGEICAVIGP